MVSTGDDMGRLIHLSEADQVDVEEYPVPKPDPGDVVTEVVRTNVCGTDVHMWRGEHIHDDVVMGHEAICRIVELGNGVDSDAAGTPVSEGDLIVPVIWAPCGHCSYCLRGERHLCPDAYRYWSSSPEDPPHFHGTFGTHYYIHTDQHFYRVPDTLPHGIAAFANCATTVALCGVEKAEINPGDTVVVQGAGGLGLNALAMANSRGAETIVVDGVESRLRLAERFGADHVVDLREHSTPSARTALVHEITDVGADVGIEVAGVPQAFAEGIELLRDGGRFIEIGNVDPGAEATLAPGKLTRKSVTVIAVLRCHPSRLGNALSFLGKHHSRYPFDELIGEEFELMDIDAALHAADDHGSIRVSLVPDGC